MRRHYLRKRFSFVLKAFFVYSVFFLGVGNCGNQDFKRPIPHYPPSFNCKKASNSLELEICKDEVNSLYDAVLGLLYQIVYSSMSDKDKVALKKEQVQWLWGARASAYKKDVDITKTREFAGYNWIQRLTFEYGNRICHLLKNHQNILEKHFYAELATYATEEEIPPILKVAFLWNLFVHYYEFADLSDKDHSQTSNGYRYYDSETRMVKISDHEWLVIFRGSYLLQTTNRDGGALSFWIVNLAKKGIYRLPVENYAYGKDVVQGYILDVNKNIISIGSGGYMGQKPPVGTMHFRLNKDKTKIKLIKNGADLDN